MSVNAVIINNKENVNSLNFSMEKLNYLDTNESNNINDSLIDDLDIDDEDDDEEEDLDGECENDVLLKNTTTQSDLYLINKNHSNFSSTSSLSSSTNSLIMNKNDLFLDAQEFTDDMLIINTNSTNSPNEIVNSNIALKNENLTIKKVDSYTELNQKQRVSVNFSSNPPIYKKCDHKHGNKLKYSNAKRYEYDDRKEATYSSKKLLNSMSCSRSKSNLSKSSASFASNFLSSSSSLSSTPSTPPLSSTSFSSLFVNTTFFNNNNNDSELIASSKPVKKMKISLFPQGNIGVPYTNTTLNQSSNGSSGLVVVPLNSNDKISNTQSKLKSLQLKLNRKINSSSKKVQGNSSGQLIMTSARLNMKKSKKNSKVNSNTMNGANASSSNGTYANKFLKLNNEFNFSKSYISKKSKKSKASMSNLSNFSSIANSSNVLPLGKKLKCLLVGDSRVGKTTLMYLFLKRIFQTEYQPTIVDDYEVKVNHNGDSYTLNLFDTAGQEDWDTLRKMAYPDTDVIILCFSVVRPDSLDNITAKWIPELNKLIPSAQIILVGTQVDLRDNNTNNLNSISNDPARSRQIDTKEGEELKQRIKAYKYIECSAYTQYNIPEVFNTCVEAYIHFNEKVEPPCSCFQSLFGRFRFTEWIRRFNLRRRNSSSKSSKTSSKYLPNNKDNHLHES